MSAESLTTKIDPAQRLPEPGDVPAGPPTYALTLDICEAAHMHSDWVGHRPSTIAGTALFVASAVTPGDYVSQPVIADLVGTTTMSIRGNMQRVAEFVLAEIDLNEHAGVDESMLSELAHGTPITELLDVQSSPSRDA